jgi:hypothetical protein
MWLNREFLFGVAIIGILFSIFQTVIAEQRSKTIDSLNATISQQTEELSARPTTITETIYVPEMITEIEMVEVERPFVVEKIIERTVEVDRDYAFSCRDILVGTMAPHFSLQQVFVNLQKKELCGYEHAEKILESFDFLAGRTPSGKVQLEAINTGSTALEAIRELIP